MWQILFIIVLIVSVLINPKYILDISFQYSYLISLSLIIVSNRLTNFNYFIGIKYFYNISTK